MLEDLYLSRLSTTNIFLYIRECGSGHPPSIRSTLRSWSGRRHEGPVACAWHENPYYAARRNAPGRLRAGAHTRAVASPRRTAASLLCAIRHRACSPVYLLFIDGPFELNARTCRKYSARGSGRLDAAHNRLIPVSNSRFNLACLPTKPHHACVW